MDYFASHIVNHLVNRMETESSGSSCPSKSFSNSNSANSSVQEDICRLENAFRTYPCDIDVNSKNYDMRTLLEMTHEELINMTQDEIKNIFQMLCRELTTTDYFCVKVGSKKNSAPNTYTGIAYSQSIL